MSFDTYIKSKFRDLKRSPKHVRIPAGILLVIGGLLGALPVLGFWMIPLGLILLAVDFPLARRILAHLKLGWRRLKVRFRDRREQKSEQPIPPTRDETTLK